MIVTDIFAVLTMTLTWLMAMLMKTPTVKHLEETGRNSHDNIDKPTKSILRVHVLKRPFISSLDQPIERPFQVENAPYSGNISYFEGMKYMIEIIIHKTKMWITLNQNDRTFVMQTFQKTTSMFKQTTLFLSFMLFSAIIFAGTPEAPSLLPDNFCSNLVKLVEAAPSGFLSIRAEENQVTKLPNSKEWNSQLGFTGSTASVISDVPEMGNYNFKTSWLNGSDYMQAIKLEQALVAKVKECIHANGWEVQELKMPSNSTNESYLFMIKDSNNPQFNNINIMVTFSDKGTFEVSLKVTYSI